MRYPVGHQAQQVEIARPQLERRAESEGVVLSAPLAQPDQPYFDILIDVPAVVAEQPGPPIPPGDNQVEVSVLIDVGYGDGPPRPQAVGKDRRVVLEPSCRVVTEQEHTTPAGRGGRGFAHHDQIELAVVVAGE